jgi:hypothetical protein
LTSVHRIDSCIDPETDSFVACIVAALGRCSVHLSALQVKHDQCSLDEQAVACGFRHRECDRLQRLEVIERSRGTVLDG